jgi:ribosomal protein S12 methylthiotransferase accessory factor
VFNGKGVDVVYAKASGLMEAVETWHAENVRLPLQFSSYADLCGRLNLIDIDGLPRRPGPVFDQHAPLLWVEGNNLMDRRSIWLPFEIVHADSRLSGPPMSARHHRSSGKSRAGRGRMGHHD